MQKEIKYIKEPTDLQCGQAVLAMLLEKSIEKIIEEVGTDRETNLKDMRDCLKKHGKALSERREAFSKDDLPKVAILSLETPRCWHWSLYFDGKFYDPEHGILSDFPKSFRKYFFEVSEENK